MPTMCLVTKGETSGRGHKSQTHVLFNYGLRVWRPERIKVTFKDIEECLFQKKKGLLLSGRATRKENISTEYYEGTHKWTQLSVCFPGPWLWKLIQCAGEPFSFENQSCLISTVLGKSIPVLVLSGGTGLPGKSDAGQGAEEMLSLVTCNWF